MADDEKKEMEEPVEKTVKEAGESTQKAEGKEQQPVGQETESGEGEAREADPQSSESAEEAAGAAESEEGEAEEEETSEEEAGSKEQESEAKSGSEAGAGKEPKASWSERMAAKKQAKQEKKQDPLKERIAELEDRTKRQLAEFENFRKRSEKEKQAMFEIGAKSVIEKILPVIDNFERGLATVPEDKKDDAFVEGMNKVYRQMLTELEKIDVKPIEAVGKEFDPNFHNAVMQVASEEYEAGVVAQELQKGYTYRDTVVRHSMVAVVSE